MSSSVLHLTRAILFLINGTVLNSAQHFLFPEESSLSSRSSLQQKKSCVTLQQCGSLLKMWQSRYIRMNTLKAIGALEQAHCGFVGVSNIPLFDCPRKMIPSGSQFDTTSNQIDPCAGTLKLFVNNDPEPDVVTRSSVQRLRLDVSRVVVTGSCCWELNSSELFQGDSVIIRPSGSQQGSWSVKSIKKLECVENF